MFKKKRVIAERPPSMRLREVFVIKWIQLVEGSEIIHYLSMKETGKRHILKWCNNFNEEVSVFSSESLAYEVLRTGVMSGGLFIMEGSVVKIDRIFKTIKE